MRDPLNGDPTLWTHAELFELLDRDSVPAAALYELKRRYKRELSGPAKLEDISDFWSDRLGMVRSYNSAIDDQILSIAKLIVQARSDRSIDTYCTALAERFELDETHIELIQLILASARYPKREGDSEYTPSSPFDYGTSPRGLFVGHEKNAELFIREFEAYIAHVWGRDSNELEPTPGPDP